MPQEKMTKKELKELRRMEKMEARTRGEDKNIVKWVVLGLTALLFIGFFVGLIVWAKSSRDTGQAVPVDTTGWTRGATESAALTLVEFSDFQCPYCRNAEPWVQQAIAEYSQELKFVYKHFPLTAAHEHALTAAYASEAAGKQGKFWEYHDLLFERQDEWAAATNSREVFLKYAQELELDTARFEQDADSDEIKDKVEKDRANGNKIGVFATPTFILNGVRVETPGSYEEFKQMLEQAKSK